MSFIKNNSFPLLIIAVIICLFLTGLYLFNPRTQTITRTETRIDTVKSVGLNEVVKRDTIVRWYEVTKEIKVPTNIYIEKIDSLTVIKYRDYDLIVSVQKKANKDLIIHVLNQDNRVLKEYVYHDVGDVFNVTSQENNLNVKSSPLQWTSVGGYIEHSSKFKWADHNVEAGIKTGFNWLDKVTLDVKAGYDINLKDFRLKQELAVYPFR